MTFSKLLFLAALPLVALTGCGGGSPPANPKIDAQARAVGIKQVGRTEPVDADGKDAKGRQTSLVTKN